MTCRPTQDQATTSGHPTSGVTLLAPVGSHPTQSLPFLFLTGRSAGICCRPDPASPPALPRVFPPGASSPVPSHRGQCPTDHHPQALGA